MAGLGSHSPDRSLLAPVYRGRLAPSPTGFLHLGHARTFWIAAERAHQAGGELVLRNEDLDPARSRPPYAAAMLEDLRWLGFTWKEGPDVGGPRAPYLQSKRRPFYLEAWRKLVEQGEVYPCRCSRRELRDTARAPHELSGNRLASALTDDQGDDAAGEDEPLYPGTCRPGTDLALAPAPQSPAGVNWRFRVPDGEPVCFEDGHFGSHGYVAGSDFGDFLIWRRDDVPAYQLAVVIDDAAMGITEVVRGVDLLKSTARQLLLYRALGLEPPAWYHCPLVTDAEGHRLAKRTDALSIRTLRERGHSPTEVLALAGISQGALEDQRLNRRGHGSLH